MGNLFRRDEIKSTMRTVKVVPLFLILKNDTSTEKRTNTIPDHK